MKPTTLTTCDDNVPRPALFMSRKSLEAAMLDHYQGVWSEVGAEGDRPETWQEIRDALQGRDLLRDHHIAHIHEHDLFAAE